MFIGTVRLHFVSFAHAPLPHVPSPNLRTLCHYQHQRTPIEVFLAADSTTSTDSYTKAPSARPSAARRFGSLRKSHLRAARRGISMHAHVWAGLTHTLRTRSTRRAALTFQMLRESKLAEQHGPRGSGSALMQQPPARRNEYRHERVSESHRQPGQLALTLGSPLNPNRRSQITEFALGAPSDPLPRPFVQDPLLRRNLAAQPAARAPSALNCRCPPSLGSVRATVEKDIF